MRQLGTLILTGLLLLSACSQQQPESKAVTNSNTGDNPFFTPFDTPFNSPDFAIIKIEHYLPAFKEGIQQQQAEVDEIINNSEAPTFSNTIEALENTGAVLTRVSNVFYNLLSAESNKELQDIALEVSPLLSAHGDNISLNPKLFDRVKAVWDQRDQLQLNREQERLLENAYKGFVRSGANLDESKKEKMREINKEISLSTLAFGQNLLKENKAFQMIVDNEADLAGLPDESIQGAAETAKELGHEGKWVFTLDKSSMIPFLKYSENRDLREKIYTAYTSRGNNGNDADNKALVAKIAALRSQRANLLGYDSHADFVLERNMAKTPEAVFEFLEKLWTPALARAKEERAEMQKMVDASIGAFQVQSWDWWYYSEKIRKSRFNLKDEDVKPYFSLDNAIEGAFTTANKLFGISFERRTDLSTYHPDVRTYEVKAPDGSHLGLFYADYHPRPGKRAGAWMNSFRKQSRFGGNSVNPIIVNVCNFSKPVGDAPSLLTFDEVQTLFHEFGHALHGLLSNCTYDSLSGTATPRDFVEFPAQLYEHWSRHPDVMKMYAKHYKTGETIPDELIEKIKKAGQFNQGFATTEYLAASLLDMAWHSISDGKERDVEQFEKETLDRLGLIPEIVARYRSTYFAHIFSGGYSSGYYAYIWSEVLDSDGFQAFKEAGIFDKETADRVLKYVYSAGGTEDPMTLYKSFRGAEPKIDALLEGRGLKN